MATQLGGSRQIWSHEQKYAYFRLRELLSFNRWELFRPTVIGITALVDEALTVLGIYGDEGRDHPKHILEELTTRLRDSVLFHGTGYSQDVKYLNLLANTLKNIKKPTNRDIDPILSALQAFKGKLKRLKTTKEIVFALRELFAQKPNPAYHEIDELLVSLVNEIASDGFSTEYIAEWLREHMFHWYGFEEYFINLIEFLEAHPTKEFTCYFRLQIPEDRTPRNFEAYGVKIQAYQTDQNQPIQFLKEGGWIAEVRVYSRDQFRALQEGRSLVKQFAGLFQITNISADKTVSSKSYVCAQGDGSIVECSVYKPSILQAKNLPKFLDVQAQEGANWSSSAVIRDAAYWFHGANEAPNQHMRLISLWTVLELLMDIRGDTIAERVLKYVPPFLKLYHVPVMVDFLQSEFVKWAITIDGELVVEAAASAEETLHNKVAFAKFIVENHGVILPNLGNRDVLKRRLRSFVHLMENSQGFKEYLENYTFEVECDLRRSYRYRNWLVHRVVVTSHTLDKTLDRLSYYVRTVINGILQALITSPSLSIKDVLICKYETCQHYLDPCKDKRPVDIIEHIVNPKSLFL